MDFMTYLVIGAFVAILGSLVAALVYMMRGGQQKEEDQEGAPPRKHMARALAFRVGFSVLLFVAILVSYFMGWIQPTGLPVRP